MVLWSMCCKQSCLHGHMARDVNISACSASRWAAPVLPRHVCMVNVRMCYRRHVCMAYRNMCFSQFCLHGLRELMLLPYISAWSEGSSALPDMFAFYTGACADPIRVRMVIRSICCSETLGAYAARDMSTWSTRACALTSKVCTVYRIL
jgi:hypothetical protein